MNGRANLSPRGRPVLPRTAVLLSGRACARWQRAHAGHGNGFLHFARNARAYLGYRRAPNLRGGLQDSVLRISLEHNLYGRGERSCDTLFANGIVLNDTIE